MLSPEELGLSYDCPDNFYVKPSGHVYKSILFRRYHWEVYSTDSGVCIALIDESDFRYVRNILFVHEAQILLSASKGVGFEEKGFFEVDRDLVGADVPESYVHRYKYYALGAFPIDKNFGQVIYDKTAGQPCNMDGRIITPPSERGRLEGEPLFSNFAEIASIHISDVVDCKVGKRLFRQD